MKLFHGIDITNVKRMQEVIENGGERLLARVFTAGEREYCESKRKKYEHYAARFAAKEAAIKAFSAWKALILEMGEIEVKKEPSGKPTLYFDPEKQKKYQIPNNAQIALSLAHERDSAIASVIIFVQD